MNTGARTKRTVIRTLEYLALLLACFIALLPIWSSFTTSFKTAEEYGKTNAMALPQNWLNFGNYAQVWTQGEMLRAFLTSATVMMAGLVSGSRILKKTPKYVQPSSTADSSRAPSRFSKYCRKI